MSKTRITISIFFLALACFSPLASPFGKWRDQKSTGAQAGSAQEFSADYDVAFYRSLTGYESVAIGDMPLSDGQGVTLELKPYLPFAKGCRIVEMRASGAVEHPLPEGRLYYKGKVVGVADSSVFFSFGPEDFSGFVRVGSQLHVYGVRYEGDGAGKRAACTLFDPSADPRDTPFCQNGLLENPMPLGDLPEDAGGAEQVESSSADRDAGIAIEMDYETFVHFGSVEAASDYAASLVGAVSTIYEADVQTTLSIANVRVWSTVEDPYAGGNNAGLLLDNLLSEYRANMAGLERTCAHLFAVRGRMGGVAYMNSLCSKIYGYGVEGINGTYTYPSSAYTWDANVFAHELGHTFGSDHTHCYGANVGLDDWIDKCYPEGRGCYEGSAIAPANMADRTLMSYCHLHSPNQVTLNFNDPAKPERGYTKSRIRRSALSKTCLSAPNCSMNCIADVPESGTVGETIQFSGKVFLSDCTGIPQVSWDFGDGKTSSATSPQHAYYSPGTYRWELVVTLKDIRCIRSGSIEIKEPQSCELSCTATAPSSGVVQSTVKFDSTAAPSNCSGEVGHSWDFGDGQTSALQSPEHTYASPGTYQWSYAASVDGVRCARSGSISVVPPCSVDCSASGPTTANTGVPVAFSSSAEAENCPGGVAYSWNFGEGGSSGEQNPTYTYSAPGSYGWSMTVSAGGAVCTRTGTVAVKDPCSISCSADAQRDSVAGTPVAFTSSAQASSCTAGPVNLWDFGDGGSSEEQNPSHNYKAAGTYRWSYTATADGVTCARAGEIEVAPPCSLTCSAGANPSAGIAPLSVGFSGVAVPSHCSGIPAFSWNFGDGALSEEENPAHLYAAAGTYAWSVVVRVDGLNCTRGGEIVVSPPCTLTCDASASPDHGRAPLEVSFSAQAEPLNCPGPAGFSWRFGDGAISSEQNPSHKYGGAGTYGWEVTVTTGGASCTRAGSVEVAQGIPGDCDGDGSVSIGELQRVTNMFLGLVSPDCGADCDGDGMISIGELQKVTNAFLGMNSGC